MQTTGKGSGGQKRMGIEEIGRLLLNSLKEGELLLHYQPVISLLSGKVEYYEALARLKDEDGEIVLPGVFLPVAAEMGLMSALTARAAAKAVAVLGEFPEIRLFINITSSCLGDRWLLKEIERLLTENPIEPGRLGFEITTRQGAPEDMAFAGEWIKHLKRQGCLFALDNFGVSQSSLYYLRYLPVDQLQIDGSFITSLEGEPNQRFLVQAIQMMARSQRLETVAEWVEKDAVAAIIKDIGITYGQGNYFGRVAPLPM